MAINNVPYSQLQIESYMDIKEALREDPAKSQLVSAQNWKIALAAFMKDMTLYQEAAKSSGFRPQRQGVEKTLDRVKNTLASHDNFKNKFGSLGLDDSTLREHISRLLTIDNFRRSRRGLSPVSSQWEDDLQNTSIVRWFDGGKDYEEIQPTAPTKANGI